MADLRHSTQSVQNRKFWIEFFLLYESLPALWNKDSILYNERTAKIAGYDIMVEKLREIEPNADHQDVLRKINVFRSNFRQEISRINTSNETGKQHRTTLWYFDLLSFLQSQQKIKTQRSNPDAKKCTMPKKRVISSSSSFAVKSCEENNKDSLSQNTQKVISKTNDIPHQKLILMEDLPLSKCLEVISLAKVNENGTIAQRTKLTIPIIEKILKYEEHIKTILKYVPNAIKFITSDKLKNIIAITEILQEFMSRLMRQNAQITDEELMLNANVLIRVFEVTDILIDDKWTLFFRNNWKQSNSIEEPIEKANKHYFYVRNILEHIQHRLDSEVVTRFNERIKKNGSEIILVCHEIFKTQNKDKTEAVDEDILSVSKESDECSQEKIDHTESAKTSELTGCYEKFHRRIDIEEYMPNINANEMLNDEPQAVSMYVKNEVEEEFIANDDSNEMIEIYAVLEEDEDDNNQNLMLVDEQTDVTIPAVGVTQNAMHQEKCIKQEYENPEDTVTKTELSLDKIKATNINSDNNDTCEIYEVIVASDDDDDDDNLINLYKEMQTTAKYTASKVNSLHKCSQELTLDQIKEETIAMDSNANIKEEENKEEEEEPKASVQHFSVEPMESEIKEKLDVTYNHTENNASYRDIKEFEELQVKQSPIQISCIEPEIKQEPIEEIFQEPPAVEYLLQQKYIVSLEHEIKEEPVANILDPNHTGSSYASKEHENLKTTPLQNLNTKVDDSVQCMEDKIDEAPDETFTSDDMMHIDTAIILKHGAHLTEQHALKIGRILHSKPYSQLSCETLSLDPIICTYMQILSNQPPLFSETALRKAFQIVLGKELYNCQYHYNIQTEDLNLYRRFVVLVYSTKYKLFQLKDIMKHIFSEFEIEFIVRNSHHIIEQWRTFFKKHFISTLYTKAVYEILFEYRTRYCLISSTLDQNAIRALPQTTTKDIQQFLHSDFELVQCWQQRYKEYVKKKVNKKPNNFGILRKCRMYTTNDLNLNCIYEDIKADLPQLVVMNLSYTRGESDYLITNSDTSKSSTTIDSLNKKMNMDSNNGEAVLENNEQNSQQNTLKTKNIRNLVRKIMKNINKTSTEEPPNKKQRTNQLMPTVVCKNLQDMQSATTSKDSDTSTSIDLRSKRINEHAGDAYAIFHNNQSMPTVICKNLKHMQSVTTTKDSDTSTSIDLHSESINVHTDDVNAAEPIEIANIYKMQTWDQSNFMSILLNDPIFNTCMLLLPIKNPVYSKTILEKAFSEVFEENDIGQYSMCQPKDLQLYSKLLLLYFSDTVICRKKLANIMVCFDESTIKDHLANASNIIIEWREFFQKNLSRILYKKAVYEMLYEYTRQYLQQENYISDEELIHKAAEIQRFLRCQIILPKLWLKYFSALFEQRFEIHNCPTRSDLFNRVHMKLKTVDVNLTKNKMSLHDIFEYIKKHQLNYLVSESVDAENSSNALRLSIDVIIKEDLGKDPIILKYFRLAHANKPADTKLPVFDENQLYASFNEVLDKCKQHSFSSDDYQLYRQLILFKYSEQCSSVAELAEIMKCFTISSIRQHFKNYLTIIRKWHVFNAKYLSSYLYQQALYEMLYEYSKRILLIYGRLSYQQLLKKSEEIKDFFNQSFDLPSNWLSEFVCALNNRLDTAENETYKRISNKALELETIYEKIKGQMHVLVRTECDSIVSRKKLESVMREPEKSSLENIRIIKKFVNKKPTKSATKESKKSSIENIRIIKKFVNKRPTVLNGESGAEANTGKCKYANVQNEVSSAILNKETDKIETSKKVNYSLNEVPLHASHDKEVTLNVPSKFAK